MSFENRYGLLDRALHRLAFASGLAQCGMADIEERLFKRRLEALRLGPPLLVTALPRAGTTILLEVLAGTRTFAAHTYREMPFVLCPLLWQRISQPFHRRDRPRERMHGDGIQVSLDSPEALEEVIWKRFFNSHYRGRCIPVWPACTAPEFAEFFAAHRRKVVALRAAHKPDASRYVSKNNLNVARLPALWDAVPDATVVVLYREPLQHASSLLRQHLRFAERHAADPFSRRYMADIGHFDFGDNLKPIDFDGWFSQRDPAAPGPDSVAFWLDYWRATYRHVLRHAADPRLLLVGFERLVTSRDLDAFAERIGVANPDELRQRRTMLHEPKGHHTDPQGIDDTARRDADSLYRQLEARAVPM